MIKTRIIRRWRTFLNMLARNKLKKHKGLWNDIEQYSKRSGTTGCSYSDYLILYNYIKEQKPTEVLECGTGVSTIVMAYAMLENERGGFVGVLPLWKIAKRGIKQHASYFLKNLKITLK